MAAMSPEHMAGARGEALPSLALPGWLWKVVGAWGSNIVSGSRLAWGERSESLRSIGCYVGEGSVLGCGSEKDWLPISQMEKLRNGSPEVVHFRSCPAIGVDTARRSPCSVWPSCPGSERLTGERPEPEL